MIRTNGTSGSTMISVSCWVSAVLISVLLARVVGWARHRRAWLPGRRRGGGAVPPPRRRPGSHARRCRAHPTTRARRTEMSTADTQHETEIIVDPDVPLVRIIREFDAPPEKVFRAHTDPELVVQWLGPRSLEMRVEHYECRTGGSYRYVHSRDGEEYGFHGAFHEVRPNELIVQTFTFEGDPDGVALEKLRLEDLG